MSDYQFNPNAEQWKEILGYPGYEVSDHGRVRSYWRIVGLGYNKGVEQILTDQPQRILCQEKRNNRCSVTLFEKGIGHHFPIHRLVLLAFKGPCPENMEGCHNDGNHNRNVLSNLRWDTKANNNVDKIIHGVAKGSKNPSSKLTEPQIIKIRQMASQGHSHKELADIFCVARSKINKIVNRKAWTHVPLSRT